MLQFMGSQRVGRDLATKQHQLQHHSFQRNPRADLLQNGLVASPCSPKDSLESCPTPEFKRINSSGLSLGLKYTKFQETRLLLFLKAEPKLTASYLIPFFIFLKVACEKKFFLTF